MRTALACLFAIGMGVLFIYSGTDKALAFDRFLDILRRHGVLDHDIIGLASVLVISAEILLGTTLLAPALLSRRSTQTALIALTVLLTIYSLYAGAALMIGRSSEDCGCGFPPVLPENWQIVIARNTGIALTSLGAACVLRRNACTNTG